jgi:uncharacterized protein (DUF2164 family)
MHPPEVLHPHDQWGISTDSPYLIFAKPYNMQRKSDRLSEEKRKAVIDELIYFFESEHDLKLGVLAAGQILDFFQASAGNAIYNRGVEDAKKAIEARMDELRFDLDELLDLD